MQKEACMTLRIIKEGKPPKMKSITSSFDVYRIMRFLELEDREKFFVLHLDAKNRVIAMELVSVGTLTNALISPREIFKGAILNNSASIICVHNHPSGDTSPSPEDKKITDRLSAVAELVDIRLLDHIIIGHGRYHSIKGL